MLTFGPLVLIFAQRKQRSPRNAHLPVGIHVLMAQRENNKFLSTRPARQRPVRVN
jgi:hypothetical protein